MLGTIRRHQTWLWVIIITVTVASFVIFGPTNTRLGDALSKGGGDFGYLGGKPITRAQLVDAKKEVILGYFLTHQQWPHDVDSPEVTLEAYKRLFYIQQQKDLGIQIGTDAVAALAHRMLGPNTSLDELETRILKPYGMDLGDFDRFLRHELGNEQLQRLAGMAGSLVTPQEAETLYRLEHQDLSASIAYFSASNFLANIKPTPDEVAKFYTNQMANYRIPEQVQVDYVKFSASDYTATAQASLTNLNQIVDNNVAQRGTNLFNGAKTPEESRAKIKEEIIRRAALQEAHKAALSFATNLDAMQPRGATNLQKLAASKNLKVQTTTPFEREYGPSDMTVPPDFMRKAFQLTQDDPFAGPIVPDVDHPGDAVYVIALKNRMPSRVPPLKEIEAKVTADYRNARAVQAAQQAALHFASTLTNGVPQGKTFNDVATAAGAKVEPLPVFSLSTRSLSDTLEEKVNFNMLRQIAFATPVGKVSQAAPARDGAFVLHVNKVSPADEAKVKKELPEFLAQMRQVRENDAFNQWLNVQFQRDPEFRQKMSQLSSEAQGQTHSGGARPRS